MVFVLSSKYTMPRHPCEPARRVILAVQRTYMKTLLPTSPEGRRALWLVPLVLAVIIVCFDKAIMPLVVSTSSTVTVPNIVGMDKQQAVDLLESQGLIVENITEQYNAGIPKGKVTAQLPYPNSHVKQGRRLYLTVSKGEAVTTMPDLSFLSQRDAQLAVMRVGMQIGTVSWEFRDSLPDNSVIRQSVPVGSVIRSGGMVDIVLSKDSTRVALVPSVVGVGYDEAIQRLRTAGLEVGAVVRKPGETYTVGTVFKQIPEAQSSVSPQTKIELWVTSE
jgi:beta-lactam-binding protein with PASTA domain